VDRREGSFKQGDPRLNREAKLCFAYFQKTFERRMTTLLINKPFFFAVHKSAPDPLRKSKDGLLPAYENIKNYKRFSKASSFLTQTHVFSLFSYTHPELEENVKNQEMKQLRTQFATNLSLYTPEWEERFKKTRNTTEDPTPPEQYSDRRWEYLRDCAAELLKKEICTTDDLVEMPSHKDPSEARCNLQFFNFNFDKIRKSIFSKSCLIKLLAQRDNITVRVFLRQGEELVNRGYDKHFLEQSVIEHLVSNPGSSYEEGRQLCGGLNDLVMSGDILENAGLNKDAQLKLLSRPDCGHVLSEKIYSLRYRALP
jgi:hypothetical protein